MPRFLLLCFLLFTAGTLAAQLTADRQVIIVENVLPTDFEKVGKANVVNTGPDTVTIRWVREVVFLTPEWATAICDRNFCWDPLVDSMEVVLGPGDTTNMDVHAYPMNAEGEGEVIVTVTDLSDPANRLELEYYFNRPPSGLTGLVLAPVRVFPNPASGYFLFEAPEGYRNGRLLLFTADGRLLRYWQQQERSHRYDLSGLQGGSCLLIFENTDRQIVGRQWLIIR